MKKRDICALLVTVVLLGAQPVYAATISVAASDSGFVTEAGGSAKFDGLLTPDAATNYSVGWEVHYVDGALLSPVVAMQRKNYFVFDLSGVSAPITDATVKLFNPVGGYESIDASETFEIGATAPPAIPGVLTDLTAIGSVTSTTEADDPCPVDALICTSAALFTTLADSLGPLPPGAPDPGKVVLASAVLTAASDGTIVDVIFTPDGIAYLNSFAGGTVVLAGGLPSGADGAPSGTGVVPQSLFGGTGLATTSATPPELFLTTVPLPAAVWLFGAALGLLGWMRRK